MTKLYTQRNQALTLNDALAAFPEQILAGFCMTPAQFVFARWDGRAVEAAAGIDLAQVYEARFFNASGELRWLRDPATAGSGSAVWIAETETMLPEWERGQPLDVEPLSESDTHRLLTGVLAEQHESLAGWRWMNAPRHGKVAVPVSGGNAEQRLAYVVREYLGSAPGNAGKDGNKMVVEERIIGITVVEGEK